MQKSQLYCFELGGAILIMPIHNTHLETNQYFSAEHK